MIREATHNDIPTLVEMGKEFYSIHPFSSHVEYHPESIRMTLLHLISDSSSKVFVCEQEGEVVGTVLVVVSPLYFNLNVNVVTEVAWFVKQDSRGLFAGLKLFKAVEEWASSINANLIIFSSLRDEGAKFFEKHGYQLYETHYVKGL